MMNNDQRGFKKVIYKKYAMRLDESIKDDSFTDIFDKLLLNISLYSLTKNNEFIDKAVYLSLQTIKKRNSYIFPLGKVQGLTGFMYILRYLDSISGGIFRKYIRGFDVFLKTYIEQMIRNARKDHLSSEYYDLIGGMGGTALYFEDFLDGSNILNIIGDFYSESILDQFQYGKNNLLLTNNNSGNKWLVSHYKHGYIDLSFSHGLVGPLIFFTNLMRIGSLKTSFQKSLCILNRMYFDSIDSNRVSSVADIVSFNHDTVGINYSYNNQLSYCYGSPGVLLSLWKLSKVRGDISTQVYYEELIKKIWSVPVEKYNLFSPTFCHGWAGIKFINGIYRKLSIISDNSFQSVNTQTDNLISNKFTSKNTFGFVDREYDRGTKRWINFSNCNSLNGVTSIYDTLFAQGSEANLLAQIFSL